MARSQKLTESIKKFKKERNAIILAHVYQRSEVQDIADYVGDPFGLSEKAVNTKADVIVFCGVQFMAETAVILNPYKTVLLPDKNAGCDLADMATDKQIIKMKKQNPGAEDNFIYRLKSDNPNKKFYPVNTLCEGMNIITLEKVKFALERMEYKVHVPEETRKKAEIALDKMLTIL